MLCIVVFIGSLPFLYRDTVSQSDVSVTPLTKLDVFAALGAQDIITFGQEATTNQRYRALLTVEAVVVPLALLKGNVLAASEA